MAAGVFVGGVSRLQQGQIVAAQVVQQFQRDFFFIQRVASDGAAGGKVLARFFYDDFGPQHAWGVVKPEIVGEK